jgi:hypothetical protein
LEDSPERVVGSGRAEEEGAPADSVSSTVEEAVAERVVAVGLPAHLARVEGQASPYFCMTWQSPSRNAR